MNLNLEEEIKKLNPSQAEAVNTIDGPVLVVAGPGTGKTQVLSYRIANILSKTDVSPSNILCLTFTETGVGEMRRRLLKVIGKEALYVKIHTFHSFCNDVIQSHPESFAFAKELIQLDDLNKIKVIRKIIDELAEGNKFSIIPFYDKYAYQRNILDNIRVLKHEGVNPEDLERICIQSLESLKADPEIGKRTKKPTAEYNNKIKLYEKNLELAQVYKKYNQELLETGFYDYEDMVLFVINKLKEDDEILGSLQEKYLYILVDEYQDTNGSQNELLRLLGSFDASPNIFAVGDDDQAIYRFQGANVENLLFFEKQFENVKTISLTTNYRSSQYILDLASSVIDNNQARLNKIIKGLDKKLKAYFDIPNNVAEVYDFETYEQENAFVAEKIRELHANGVKYSDIAVFFRKHSDGTDLALELVSKDIPIILAAGRNALEQTPIIQLINLLKVINFTDKDRNKLLFNVLFYNFFEFKRLDVFKITRAANDRKLEILDIILNKDILLELGVEEIDKIFALGEQIVEWKAEAANYMVYNFLVDVACSCNYMDFYIKKGNVETVNSIKAFFNYVKNVNLQNKNLTLEDLLEDIVLLEANRLSIEESGVEIQKDGVNLMTAHKSKGLEFKYVFIIKCYDKNWGNNRVSDKLKLVPDIFNLTEEIDTEKIKADEMEDERRLFFVALTRAKEKLYITHAKVYPSGNSTKEVSPSIFISELNSKLTDFNHPIVQEEKEEAINITKLSANLLSPYTIDEQDYLKKLVKDFKLSASALNEYIECPLKFKFDCLLKAPKPLNIHTSLGTAIHYAFEYFYRNLIKGEVKDLDYLRALFITHLDKQLLNDEDYKNVKDEGLAVLESYYNYYKDRLETPADVEYGFFNKGIYLEIPEMDPIELTGKIDKIEWINKSDNAVRLVDYKTSDPKTDGDIKGTTKSSNGSIFRQLTFYKLLTDLDKNFRPVNKINKYRVDEVQVDFLKPDKNKKTFVKKSFTITDEDIYKLKSEIKDVMTRVRNLEFGSEEYPNCKDCSYCKLFEKTED